MKSCRCNFPNPSNVNELCVLPWVLEHDIHTDGNHTWLDAIAVFYARTYAELHNDSSEARRTGDRSAA